MDTEIMVETLPLLGMCNLCLNEGAVKSMLVGHKHNGKSEVYSEMLVKCFSIDVSILQLGDTKRLICEFCITRLRDCVLFKDLVEVSLNTLENTYKLQKEENHSTDDGVKTELSINANFDDDFHNVDVDDDDDDDDPKIKAEIKSEPDECTRKTRSRSVKKITKCTGKKHHDFTETESMLKTGLFPFKIRKNRTFSCSICPEKSTNLDDIKVHVIDHNKTNLHMAFKKMIFSNSQRFYKSGTKLRCKICTTDVATYDELRQHVENCTRLKFSNRRWNNLPFKLEKDQLDCPVCKKTFLNYVSLNTHMNVHYPNYICENCGKAFASKARLRGHMRTHEVGSFPCKYCNATFDRVTKRENHVSKEHKSGIRYACKRCNISLTSFYARQKHLAEVHNEELKRYKCKACPQSYITPGHLSSHVRRDHLNERNHKCDKCDLAFYTKNALKMHMIKHDGERIHTCPVCQKSYQRKKTLREHLRIHNNDKRFVCPVCGRAFTQKCTLKGHLKVHERKPDLDDRVVPPLHSI
ncbi:PR domain zinc finger protein 5-like isoform X1 [Spodoptera litura]|uniref:PR domain zinc finger protein 5-like isoform X1 n=1 Tax=Spodoptera litura TaxID=69820 RepID=A0A9J7E0U0_SPOLT|nr:PR domain zinc finger protein 5-like isoform X1 [Spodoptera litura]